MPEEVAWTETRDSRWQSAYVALALAHELADPDDEGPRPEEGAAAPELREADLQAGQLDANRQTSEQGRRAVADAGPAVAALHGAMAADGAGPVDSMDAVGAWVGVDRSTFESAVEQAIAVP